MRFLFLAAIAALFFVSAPEATAQDVEVEFISDTNDARVVHGKYYRIRFNVINTGASDIRGGVFVTFDVPGGGQFTRRVENTVLRAGESREYRFKELFRPTAPLGQYGVTVTFEEIDRSAVLSSNAVSVRVVAS
ncbi:MAG: hypothetical protein AAFQ43_12010 [Bacteroidota bacterium]